MQPVSAATGQPQLLALQQAVLAAAAEAKARLAGVLLEQVGQVRNGMLHTVVEEGEVEEVQEQRPGPVLMEALAVFMGVVEVGQVRKPLLARRLAARAWDV